METLEKTYWIINEDGLIVSGRAANARLSGTMLALDKSLDFPVRIYAAQTPDSKLYLAPSVTVMGDGGAKAPGPLNNVIPTGFPLSTIDFQTGATTGGSITISLPASTLGMFRRCAFSLDNAGAITASFSGESGSIAGLTNAGSLFVANSLPVGWIDLECTNASGQFKTALSTTNVIENQVGGVPRIVRIQAGGGGSGSANAGISAQFDIPSATDTFTVTFPTALYNTSYVVQCGIFNEDDVNPQFLIALVSNKTVNGFDVKLNAPTDSANYKLSYLVPAIQEQIGEGAVNAGDTTTTVTLPIPLAGTTFSVVAQLVDYTDLTPQFQPVTVTGKTSTSFTAQWNAPTDSANYRLAYHVAEYT